MKFPRISIIAALALASSALSAQTADPQLSSWQTSATRRYARIYPTDAARLAGTPVTTWSRGTTSQPTPSYAGVIQVSSSASWVYLRTSGLGTHVMGPWYLNAAKTVDFPGFPANTGFLYRLPRTPVIPATKTLTPAATIGYFVDGVAVFDFTDTFSYVNATGADGGVGVGGSRGDGIWIRDAYHNEAVTFDPAFAHQAGTHHHYHANAPATRYQLGDNVDFNATTKIYTEKSTVPTKHSPIVGWLADGLPVYGPYGYSSPMNAASGVRRMISGYVKRDGANGTTNLAATGRTTLPGWAVTAQNRTAATLTTTQYGPPVNANFALGHYLEDHDYLGNLGKTLGTDFDLNLYNVRFCVTPEFPAGTWAYFIAIETDGTPKYPYIVGRWYYGSPTGSTVTAIGETVTEYVRASQASPIGVTATNTGGTVAITWTSVEGATYRIETSPDGTAWSALAAAGALTSSGGDTTSFSTTTVATNYRVTLTALATYDTDSSGGLSGVGNVATATIGSTGTATIPTITTQPASLTVATGASATFTVVAGGTAPLAYQWSKAGAPISGATNASYTIASTAAADAGTFTVTVTNAAGSATSAAATLTVTTTATPTAPTITAQPASLTVATGASATFTVVAGGTAPFTYQWSKAGVPISGGTSSVLTLPNISAADGGNYVCVVTNAAGSATTNAAGLIVTVAPTSAPTITTQPVGANVTAGAAVSFTVVAGGTAPLAYQWRKDGAILAGGVAATYTLTAAQPADAGGYTCVVTNALGSATSAAAVLTVAPAPATARLISVATRARIGGAAGTPIAGFLLAGAGTKPLLLRAVGPGLAVFNVAGVLADPRLGLVRDGATLGGNDNWLGADAATMTATGAFALAAGSRDAALVTTLAAGLYSTPITATDGGAGVVLLETYDAATDRSPTLTAASTRAFAGTGDNVLIPAFIIGGTGSLRVLVRGIGPALAAFNITDALADPTITLYRDQTALATNDNWSAGANAAELAAAAASVGAFALAGGSRDAAIIATLPAGAYTAVLNGVGGTTGTALVEIYALP